MLRRIAALCALAALPLAAQQGARQATLTTAERFDRAYFAWDAGRYDEALVDLKAVLAASDADAWQDRVAELTGEIYQTVEVAKDARTPVWSADGRHLAYATGTGAAAKIVVVRNEAGFPVATEGTGVNVSFAPDGRSVAWLYRSAAGRPAIRWVPLGGGEAQDIPLDAASASSLTLLGTAPLRVALIVGDENASKIIVRDLTGNDGTWREVAVAGRNPIQILSSPNGRRALVTLGERSAFARFVPGFAGGARSDSFAEFTPTGLGAAMGGVSPVWARSSSAFAWIENGGEVARVRVKRDGEPTTAATLEGAFMNPALSPDGRTVVFGQMPREDWELFAVPADGSESPRRLTHEIQHDLFPQFISDERLLGVIGEGRHRRSYLYDLSTGDRTRLFHNNTVRTVAPEYEWEVSPDGSRVAIVSERDGDTVTPHRHLYVTDLGTKVPRTQLVARVDSMLGAERALRENGRRAFAPIAEQVRAAVAEVSTGRIYSYEKALFEFDSKHITQPGNWKATDWLLAQYQSFGLDAHLQRFTTLQGGEIPVANVVATVKGTVNPELIYVVGAHFDSRAEGPGADDNTSGTAMILEAARVLAKRPLPATVMFVAFTGEESGLRGAREFGRRMKDSIHVVGALNNDMMGWSNDSRMDNTIRYSNTGIRDIQHAAAIQFSELITYDAFYYKSTDAHALYDAWGDIVGGIGSYPILGNPHYHQVHDVLETINHRQLAETSKTTIATIMLLASSPSRLVGLTAAGKTATWERAVEKEITGYIVRYGPASNPMQYTSRVTNPRITLNSLQPGWHIAVKAVNAKGMEGWDWARAVVQ
ncbi:MAG: M20/M25/M40 family metallo-hydrolase [Gemmatimonadaceae bacterium]|nr:M20/M25/M40 family metallo-hydrolase [Gemmatimonadaceae bacterium]